MMTIDYLLLMALLTTILFAGYFALMRWLQTPVPPHKRMAPRRRADKSRTRDAASSAARPKSNGAFYASVVKTI